MKRAICQLLSSASLAIFKGSQDRALRRTAMTVAAIVESLQDLFDLLQLTDFLADRCQLRFNLIFDVLLTRRRIVPQVEQLLDFVQGEAKGFGMLDQQQLGNDTSVINPVIGLVALRLGD